MLRAEAGGHEQVSSERLFYVLYNMLSWRAVPPKC